METVCAAWFDNGRAGRERFGQKKIVHKQKEIRGQLGKLSASTVPVRSAANAPSEPAGP